MEWQSSVEMSAVFTSDTTFSFSDLDGRRQRLCAGQLSFARGTAFDPDVSLGMVFTDELAFHGGRLFLGEGIPTVGPDGAQYWERTANGVMRIKPYRIAVWEGSSYSFYAHRYGDEAADLLRSFERLVVEEDSRGLVCRPTKESVATYKPASIMQVIPKVGDFRSLRLTSETARSLPRHEGTKVRGGELYARESDHGVVHLTLVNDSAITQITPDEDADEDYLMECVTELVVNWR